MTNLRWRRVFVGVVAAALLAALPPEALSADPPRRSARKAVRDAAPAPADARTKRYTFNSRFYKVTTDLPDRARAIDIAKHMDAVYVEYSSRMAGFRPNPNAAVRPDERMNLYVMKSQQDYLDLHADF